MAKKLKTFVHVPDKNGVYQAFGPDDEVPGWAADAITNPDVWDDGSDADVVPTPGPSQLPGQDVDVYGSGALKDRKVSELKALAVANGVDDSGSKSEIVARLSEAGLEPSTGTNEDTNVEA